jgi:hypothetical protein
MLLWLIAVVAIPIFTIVLLFFTLADDFWKLITFQLDLSKLFGELIHAVFIILLGIGCELFAVYELVRHLF